ncbi:hypothetical protein [Bacillus thuringiensis]|uniref:hypothetical protein n=1 Tax=Bacillus thuringiensis TaxID=1428 RepID=UPI002AB42DB1|nr:hypothetical protein [Bacillus thuringiensis]MDY7965620.1 hypothetical protein [Bacillus thuringiensis]
MLSKLNMGDFIKVYSAGTLEGQGNYICTFQDENSSFLSWKNDQGNEVFTNISSISVEILKRINSYKISSQANHASSYPDNYTSTYPEQI